MSEAQDPPSTEEKVVEGSVFPGDTPAQTGPSMGVSKPLTWTFNFSAEEVLGTLCDRPTDS